MQDDLKVTLRFPPGFLWGTATASHQVEGGNHNNWSAWEALGGGRIFQDHVSGDAAMWWDGQAEPDFDRAAGMHNNALRLSLEWSRIQPAPDRWDEDALARYRELIVALRARGLEPMVTLHHFTHPVWLEERGGWMNEEMPRLFGEYAGRVADALGDQVKLWCTLNEPMVYATQSYLFGKWPPGRSDLAEVIRVAVHMAQGHAAAYNAIKPRHRDAQIGFAKHQISFRAGTPVIGHIGAWLLNYLFNEMFFGPFLKGRLRSGVRRDALIPEAKGTLDWVGLQYYSRYTVQFAPQQPQTLFFTYRARKDYPHGPDGWGELAPWEVYPRIRHLHKLTQLPIYVTEVGVPDYDDTVRPGYLAETIHGVWRACMHSYPVKGMFFWSLIDNFEWAEGYDPRFRFGLYGVDFATQAREERRSARLYRAVCGDNALTADIVREYAPEAFDNIFPTPGTDSLPR